MSKIRESDQYLTYLPQCRPLYAQKEYKTFNKSCQ